MRQLKITKSITNRESQSLDKYLQEIGREELITVEEEVELAARIRKGDRRALEKLTRANLRFREGTTPFPLLRPSRRAPRSSRAKGQSLPCPRGCTGA